MASARSPRATSRPAPARPPRRASSGARPGPRDSWDARKLVEAGLPLFHVRVASLLRLLRHVIEEGGVAGEVEEADLSVAVCVHRRLHAAQRHRREREHLPAPLQRLLLEPLERHDGVDEAHVEGLLGVVLPAEEPDLARFLLTDDARQVRRAEAAVEGADARAGLAEARVLRGDGDVADDVEHVPAADGVAGDHGHDRLRQAADLLLYVEDVEARDALGVDIAGLPAHALIAAGAERLIAFAGEDDDADLRVVAGHVEGLLQLADGERAKGVAHLRPVDGDLGDAVGGALVLDVLELMDGLPSFCHSADVISRRGTDASWPRRRRAAPTGRGARRPRRSRASRSAPTPPPAAPRPHISRRARRRSRASAARARAGAARRAGGRPGTTRATG